MKVFIYLFLIFMSINTLVSQSVDLLEPRMHPEVNKLEFNNDPRILLLENDESEFMLFDPYSRSLIETNENNFVFSGENVFRYPYWFWYPHTKTSYLRRFTPLSTDENPNGWFKLVWNAQKSMVEAELQDDWEVVNYCPPIVKMLDSRYEMISSYGNRMNDRIQRIIIRDVETGKVYLENFLRTEGVTYNYLWIGDTFILEDRSSLFLTPDPDSAPHSDSRSDLRISVNTSLYNFVTGYRVSFYPDIIIGYGEGYIITTGSDFIGFRIWDLSGEVVYYDKDNTLFKQKFVSVGKLELGLSYFDNPFVYIPFEGTSPYTASSYFIINLQTNEVMVLGRGELESIDALLGVIRTE